MTDFHDGDEQRAPGTMRGRLDAVSRGAYALGAILSVGLVIGMGVWGYKLLVRDVSGVPVIRAAEGPIRVQPEDPGGRQTLNQGLSVNDVAARGSAGTAPDELVLAPAPLDLSDEDKAGEEAAPRDQKLAQLEEGQQAAPEKDDPDAAGQAGADDAKMQALAEAIGDGATPLDALSDAPRAEGDAETVQQLRPQARPDDLGKTRTVAARDTGRREIRDVDPQNIPAGTRLAQLGAFASEQIARDEWKRIGARFEEYISDKDRVIQKASSGGRTFYRLRAMGFDDLGEARRFCSALIAEKADCIPVVTR